MSIATAIVGTLVDPISNLLSEFIVDKDKQAEISYKIATMAEQNAHAQVIAQLEINKAEASSESLFKGGWRPACGWLTVFALGINYVVIPMGGPIVEAYTPIIMQPLDMTVMLPLLMGMLGLTGARTLEKTKGVASR
jgi:hypothetical protein|tara:strand:- start:523 stop:933 length:411 start_codon:yes stop_codon:yes gene_type:complete